MPAQYARTRGRWCRIAAPQRHVVEFPAVDRLDRAILSQLQENGRLANAELAGRIRLSPSATLRRVRNLEASGAIAGYHADVHPAAVGRGFQVTVHATLMLRNRETIEAFEAAVAQLDDVVECHRMFGDPDYLIRVAVADAEAYERFLINTFADLPGLARMTSQFTMKTIKPGGRLPL
jgi:DNA-binding Lrp family transcriptional regulator